MLDINFIRQNLDKVKEGIQKKNANPKLVDKFLRLDNDWRAKTAALDQLKAEQNRLNKEMGSHQSKDTISRAQILKKRIKEVSDAREDLKSRRDEILQSLPNLPFDDVPVGNLSAAKTVKEWGEKPKFFAKGGNFKPRDYLSLAEPLGLIDVKKASQVAGSRFSYLLGDAARLEFALVKLAFDVLIENGFVPVVPPVMIRPKIFEGMGRLAIDQKDERYYLPKDDLYLIGSAEHTLGPLHMNESLGDNKLPIRYAGFSTCFRREAGSYGKDTKGILRVHQFDKVEMFSFSRPKDSEKEHQFLLSMQEKMIQLLHLPYRVVLIPTGDMGFTDAKQYDIETWLPGSQEYRETHSCSNTTDFQARGINVKYANGNNGNEYVHLLNATAFAIGRIIIAIIENYQTKKGTIKVPDALKNYVGKSEIG